MEDSKSSLNSSFLSGFLGTFISRLSGMLRDITMAYFFGTGAALASFMVAFRFANLFRRILGESAMQAGFIPHFESIRTKDGKLAAKFFRDLFFSLLILLLIIVFIFQIGLWGISKTSISLETQNIIFLISIMIFGLIFISLYSLNSALLQCEKKYFLPAVAPTIFNIIWILTAILSKNYSMEKAVYRLAVGVVIGFFMQWFITAFGAFRFIIKHIPRNHFFKSDLFSGTIQKLIKPMSFGIIGLAAVQINTALDSVFAKVADPSGPAYLWYAIRLEQLPIALFAISLSGAVFPPLSRAFQNNNIKNYLDFLSFTSKKAVSFMVFSTFFIFAIGFFSIQIVYGRGAFDIVSSLSCLKPLWAYSIGLVFLSLTMIFSSAFYAQKNYFIPMKGSVYSVILNIFLNSIFIFVFDWSYLSIALATSLSAIFNVFYLLLNFSYFSVEKSFVYFIFKTLIINLLSLIVVCAVGYFFFNDPSLLFLLNKKLNLTIYKASFFINVFHFLTLAGLYVMMLAVLAYIFKENEILNIFNKILKQLNRRKQNKN